MRIFAGAAGVGPADGLAEAKPVVPPQSEPSNVRSSTGLCQKEAIQRAATTATEVEECDDDNKTAGRVTAFHVGGFGARSLTQALSTKQRQRVSGRQSTKAVFLDPNQVKEHVRRNLDAPADALEKFKEDGLCSGIVTSQSFESFMVLIISFNALWIAVDTDFNGADTLMEADPVFIAAENIFCTIFATEIMLRFLAFRSKRDALSDGWFVFDATLVTFMVLETWIFVLVLAILGGSSGSGLVENTSILRIARMFRLARMARMARLLRFVPELLILIKGMMSAARSVFFTLCLLFMLLYVFAIALTQLTVDTHVSDRFFASVAKSMYTLFISGSLLQNVGIICDALGNEHLFFGGVYISFVILSALMVMNMLTGVLCEVVSAVAAIEKDQMLITYVKSRMLKVIQGIDQDGDHCVSRAEFESMLLHAEAVRALTEVGVDVVGLVDFADVIFEEEDILSFGQFMEIVLEFRGSNGATVKDIIELRKLIRHYNTDTMFILSEVRKSVQMLVRDTRNQTFDNEAGAASGASRGTTSLDSGEKKNARIQTRSLSDAGAKRVVIGENDRSRDGGQGVAKVAFDEGCDRGDDTIRSDQVEDFTGVWSPCEASPHSVPEGTAGWRQQLLSLEPSQQQRYSENGKRSQPAALVEPIGIKDLAGHSFGDGLGDKYSSSIAAREWHQAYADDFRNIRTKLARLDSHLSAGLNEVKVMQQTLSGGKNCMSQDGEIHYSDHDSQDFDTIECKTDLHSGYSGFR